MTTLQSLLLDLRQFILGISGTVAGYAAAFAALGLLLGIALVFFARRRKIFQRLFSQWPWITPVNSVLIPLFLLALGAFMGGIIGAQTATDGFIDRHSESFTPYSKEYLPLLQQYVRQSARAGSKATVEQMVAGQMATNPDIEPNTRLYKAVYELNLAAVQQGLKPLMRGAAQQDPLDALQKADLSKLNERTFATVPQVLHLRSNAYFFDAYMQALWGLLVLLLLPLLEIVAYRLLPHSGARKPAAGPSDFQAAPRRPSPELTMRSTAADTFVSPPYEAPAAPLFEKKTTSPAEVPPPLAETPPAETFVAPEVMVTQPQEEPQPLDAETPLREQEEQGLETENLSVEPPVPTPEEAPLAMAPVLPVVETPPPAPPVAPPPIARPVPVVAAQTSVHPAAASEHPNTGGGGINKLANRAAIQSVTLILCGALLQVISGIGNSYAASLVAIFGFILYFTGLGRLQNVLDATGQRGAGMLRVGAMIGLIGAILGMIPLLGGIIGGVFSLLAFFFELLGLLQLRNSHSFGPLAKSGFGLQLVGLGMAVMGSIFSMLPLVGSFFGSFFFVGVLLLFLYGWMRVQDEFLHDPHIGDSPTPRINQPAGQAPAGFASPTNFSNKMEQHTPNPMEQTSSPSGGSVNATVNIQIPDLNNLRIRKSIIPGLFGLTLLFFFFTFCEFSCQGNAVAKVSGIQMVTGTSIETPDESGPSMGGIFGAPSREEEKESKSMPPNIWAILAMLGALAGAVIFLIGNRLENMVGMIAGGVGALSLLILKSTVQNAVIKETKGFITADFTFAFWLAVLSLLGAGVLCFLRWQEMNKKQAAPPPEYGA